MNDSTYQMLLKLLTALRRGKKKMQVKCLFNDPNIKGLFRSCNMCLVQSTCIVQEKRIPKPLVYDFCFVFNKPCENIVDDLINLEMVKKNMTIQRNAYFHEDIWKVIIDAPPIVIKTKKKRKKNDYI